MNKGTQIKLEKILSDILLMERCLEVDKLPDYKYEEFDKILTELHNKFREVLLKSL